ncbi:hypothetical protein SSS_06084 [Sarcoptes scabiei]|nr:hypothetical protein SSS_06084 [Sarcoptes scabiei]
MTDKLLSDESCDSDAELLNNLPLNGTGDVRQKKNPHRRLSLNLAQNLRQHHQLLQQQQQLQNFQQTQSPIDPFFEPKVLRKNKSISKIESLAGSLVKESKVLVIYTGVPSEW